MSHAPLLLRKMLPVALIPLLLVLASLAGCSQEDPTAAKVAREAADRQAEQNRRMAEVLKAENQARQEVARLQRDLQSQQADLSQQRNALESERRQMATQRQRESFWIPFLETAGIVLVCALALVYCIHLAYGLRDPVASEQKMGELLIEELAFEKPILLPPVRAREDVPVAQLPAPVVLAEKKQH